MTWVIKSTRGTFFWVRTWAERHEGCAKRKMRRVVDVEFRKFEFGENVVGGDWGFDSGKRQMGE